MEDSNKMFSEVFSLGDVSVTIFELNFLGLIATNKIVGFYHDETYLTSSPVNCQVKRFYFALEYITGRVCLT